MAIAADISTQRRGSFTSSAFTRASWCDFICVCMGVLSGCLMMCYCVLSFGSFRNAYTVYAHTDKDSDNVPVAILLATIVGFVSIMALWPCIHFLLLARSYGRAEERFCLLPGLILMHLLGCAVFVCALVMHVLSGQVQTSMGDYLKNHPGDLDEPAMLIYRAAYWLGYLAVATGLVFSVWICRGGGAIVQLALSVDAQNFMHYPASDSENDDQKLA